MSRRTLSGLNEWLHPLTTPEIGTLVLISLPVQPATYYVNNYLLLTMQWTSMNKSLCWVRTVHILFLHPLLCRTIPPYHSESHTLRFNWNKEASLSIWDKHLLPASSHASFHGKNSVSTSCLNHLLHICTLSSAVIWEEGDLTAWEFVAQSWHWSEMFMAAVDHFSASTTRAIWSQQLDELSVLHVYK